MIISAALLVGIGAGVLIGWPIFTSNSPRGPVAEANVDAYDVEVLCNYMSAAATAEDEMLDVEDEGFDPSAAYHWRLSALGGLAKAAGLADPSEWALEEAGAGLIAAVARLDREIVDENLTVIQTFCDSRN